MTTTQLRLNVSCLLNIPRYQAKRRHGELSVLSLCLNSLLADDNHVRREIRLYPTEIIRSQRSPSAVFKYVRVQLYGSNYAFSKQLLNVACCCI